MMIRQFSEHTFGIYDAEGLKYVTSDWKTAVLLSRGDGFDSSLKHFIWYSRHDPLQAQVEELYGKFGPYVLEKDENPFSSVQEAVNRFRESGADELVVVAPLSVMAAFCDAGIQPLRAEMELIEKVPEEESPYAGGLVSIQGSRIYRHRRFLRLVKIEIVMEPIDA